MFGRTELSDQAGIDLVGRGWLCDPAGLRFAYMDRSLPGAFAGLMSAESDRALFRGPEVRPRLNATDYTFACDCARSAIDVDLL